MARLIKKYTPAFKEKVISEIASGKFGSFEEAQFFYRIGGNTTIKRWIVKAGRTDLLPIVEVIDI